MRARALVGMLLGLLASCTVAFDVSSLDDGCGPNEKRCGDACVPKNEEWGCASASCSPCSPQNGKGHCSAEGECEILPPPAEPCFKFFANCDDNLKNGCEVNTATDPDNCGGCDVKACPEPLPNAEPACATDAELGAVCGIRRCSSGWADCDGDALNGCEVETASDPRNCGTCGHECGELEPCVGGVCTE